MCTRDDDPSEHDRRTYDPTDEPGRPVRPPRNPLPSYLAGARSRCGRCYGHGSYQVLGARTGGPHRISCPVCNGTGRVHPI
jgi:hypothetical protein